MPISLAPPWKADPVPYQQGDRVEYIAESVFDLIIVPGDVGTVTREADGWVFAIWPRSGEHSVPVENVRPASSD